MPPWNSTGTLKTWLSVTELPEVCDAPVAVGMVHVAELDPVAGDVGDHVALDHVVLRAVAERQAGGAEVDEGVAGELDVLVVGQRDVAGDLGPRAVRARAECVARRRDMAQALRSRALRPGHLVVRLDLGEPVAGALGVELRSEPRGVGELDPREDHVVQRRRCGAAAGDQLLQHRRLDVGGAHRLTGARDVVQLAVTLVEEPLAGGARAEELEGVLHARRLLGDGAAADQVVGPAVRERPRTRRRVGPARLRHGHGRAAERGHRAPRLGPRAEPAPVDELQLRFGAAGVAPGGHRRAAAAVAGGVLAGQRGGKCAVGPRRARAVDVQLPRLKTCRSLRHPDRAAGAHLLPAGDLVRAGQYRMRTAVGGPDHVVAVGAGVRGGECQRAGHPVEAVFQDHGDIGAHVLVQSADQGLRPADRLDRRRRGPGVAVAAVRRDVDLSGDTRRSGRHRGRSTGLADRGPSRRAEQGDRGHAQDGGSGPDQWSDTEWHSTLRHAPESSKHPRFRQRPLLKF